MKLRDYQITAIDGLRHAIRSGYKKILLQAGTGCHHPDERMLMSDGSTKAAIDICIEDSLAGPDGLPRQVAELHEGVDEMYEVSPIKGDPFIVNAGHLLALRRTNDGTRSAFSQRIVSVKEWLTWSENIKHLYKLERSGYEFKGGEELPMDPYFLGVLLGDGSFRNGVSIDTPDPEIISEIYRQAAVWGVSVRKQVEENSKSDNYHLVVKKGGGRKNPITRCLEKMNLMGLKSGEKFIPDGYRIACHADRLSVLAGLLDTDGHMIRGGFDFLSKSKKLSSDLTFIARSLGLSAYLKPCIKHCPGTIGTYYRVSVSGDCSIIPTKIERKKAPPRRQKKNNLVTGFSCRYVGVGEYAGFTVTGDNLYLDECFTIHHNSGKTVIAAEIIRKAVEKGKSSIFLVHRRVLAQQSSNKLTEAGVDHGILMAGHDPVTRHVTVASVQTMDSWCLKRGILPWPQCDLLIVDECHLSLSPLFSKIIEHYPSAIVIGMTATPARGAGQGLGDLYEKMVQCPSIKELISQGYLVPPVIYAPSQPDLASVRIRAGDYVEADLAAVLDKPKLVGDIVENFGRICPDRKAIVFTISVAHSKHVMEAFIDVGISAAHVDGNTPQDERDDIDRRHRSGEIQVLCNCAVFTTGYDNPGIDCVILARPSKSVVLYIQTIGRGLRTHTGKADCIIIDHAGAVHEHGFPDEFDDWELTTGQVSPNKVQEKRKEKEAHPITCENCFTVFVGKPICPTCGHKHESKGRSQTFIDGELGEVSRETKAVKEVKHTKETKQRWFSQLNHYCREKGYKPGWASNKYRDKFKVWPQGLSDTLQEPGAEVLGYIRHSNIKWAKRKKKMEAQA